MSRAKVDFRFVRVPSESEWDSRWFDQSFLARSLGTAIWMLGDGEPVRVGENWAVSLCRALRIDGPERPNIVRALRRLSDAGLLVIRDGSARCLLRVCDQSVTSLTPVCDQSVTGLRSVSPQNDSTPILQTDREEETEEREKTRARADIRKPLPEPPPELSHSGIRWTPWIRIWKLFEELAGPQGHPAVHRESLESIADLVGKRTAGGGEQAFDAEARKVLNLWLSDPWVVKNRPAISNLGKNPGRYGGLQIKPLVSHPAGNDLTAFLAAEQEQLRAAGAIR